MTTDERDVLLEAGIAANLLEVLAIEGIERGTTSPLVLAWLKGVQEVVVRKVAGIATT